MRFGLLLNFVRLIINNQGNCTKNILFANLNFWMNLSIEESPKIISSLPEVRLEKLSEAPVLSPYEYVYVTVRLAKK